MPPSDETQKILTMPLGAPQERGLVEVSHRPTSLSNFRVQVSSAKNGRYSNLDRTSVFSTGPAETTILEELLDSSIGELTDNLDRNNISGSTLSIAALSADGKLVCRKIGNSPIVIFSSPIGSNNITSYINIFNETDFHDLRNPLEVQRIIDEGGTVIIFDKTNRDSRVLGDEPELKNLAQNGVVYEAVFNEYTKSLGYESPRDYPLDGINISRAVGAKNIPTLSSEPAKVTLDLNLLDPNKKHYLLICSDAFAYHPDWKHEVGTSLSDIFKQGKQEEAAEFLTALISRRIQYLDNATTIMVELPAIGEEISETIYACVADGFKTKGYCGHTSTSEDIVTKLPILVSDKFAQMTLESNPNTVPDASFPPPLITINGDNTQAQKTRPDLDSLSKIDLS